MECISKVEVAHSTKSNQNNFAIDISCEGKNPRNQLDSNGNHLELESEIEIDEGEDIDGSFLNELTESVIFSIGTENYSTIAVNETNISSPGTIIMDNDRVNGISTENQAVNNSILLTMSMIETNEPVEEPIMDTDEPAFYTEIDSTFFDNNDRDGSHDTLTNDKDLAQDLFFGSYKRQIFKDSLKDSLKTTVYCSQQQGYKYQMFGSKARIGIHPKNEDFYFPLNNPSGTRENVSTHGDEVYLMADGHAGHEAPEFFINRLVKGVMKILNSKKYYFGDTLMQHELKDKVTELYMALDAEYMDTKIKEYQIWIANGSKPGEKPVDDGCTMVLNIIQAGWIMNCNVGDSRTVIAQMPCSEKLATDEWNIVFASDDHNMMNTRKVYSIHQNGGKFLDHSGKRFLNLKVDHPDERQGRLYHELASARLFRPLSDEVKAVGCSHRRTLNLSGTMGDLLFKIDPAIITCAPDVSFIKLDQNYEHYVIIATDGIFDHLTARRIDDQNFSVVEKLSSLFLDLHMNEIGDSDLSINSDNSLGQDIENSSLNQILGIICDEMVDREGGNIFSQGLIRYDDASFMLINISKV